MATMSRLAMLSGVGVAIAMAIGCLVLWSPASRNRAAGELGLPSESGKKVAATGHGIASRLSHTQLPSLRSDQRRALEDVASEVVGAYTSGSYSGALAALGAIRNESIDAKVVAYDINRADKELRWFYQSLWVDDGPIAVMPISDKQPDVSSPEYAALAQGRNASMSVHKEGISILDRPMLALEVQVPISYTYEDGTPHSAFLALRLGWSEQQRRWIQVGAGMYGFPTGRPLPMLPY